MHQNVILYHNYYTTMCYIWCGMFPLDFTTTIDIVPQSVAFLLQSVVFPMNYPKTNCSIVLQNIIVYNKNSIPLKCKFLAVKTAHNKKYHRYSRYMYYNYIYHDGFRQRKNPFHYDYSITITFTIINFTVNIFTIIINIVK